uniref:Ig-like domain-containing protein n=1 Tax=Monodelphis domestica TaxID=13616 RepID=F6Z7Z2_MONDO
SEKNIEFAIRAPELSLQFCSLLYICLQKVEQSPQALRVQEGEDTTINCSFTEFSQSLQWFRQDPGKGLISLFYLTSEMKEKGRFRSTIILKERHSSLYIDASQPSDSATYLCAVRAQ